MSYYHSIDSEFFNLNRYSRHGRQYAQSLSSSANVEQGEHLPASIDFLDDFFLTPQALIPSSSAAQASLPIQTSLSGMPVLRQSYLDIAFNSSRTLSVEAPVPVSHAARMKAGLRTMMSCDNQDTLNHNSGFVGGETLKITNVCMRGDLDDNGLHSDVQAVMDYNILVNSGNNKQTTTTGPSKLVIRPISPATLMALTEPCLMAWCTAFDDSTSLAQPGSSPYLPLQNLDYNNFVVDKINVWGY